MLGLIYLGLLIMPISALFFGALFLQRKLKWLSIPLFLVSGVVGLYLDFDQFHNNYSIFLDREQWGFVADVMGIWPFLLTLNALGYGFLACVLFSTLRKFQDKSSRFSQVSGKVLIGLFVFSIASMSYEIYFHQQSYHKIKDIKLASGAVTSDQITTILQSNNSNAIMALLENPNCPLEVLSEYAASFDLKFRSAVIANQNLPADIVSILAKDEVESIRFRSTSHKNISNEILESLTKDSSKDVRERAKTELLYRSQSKK